MPQSLARLNVHVLFELGRTVAVSMAVERSTNAACGTEPPLQGSALRGPETQGFALGWS